MQQRKLNKRIDEKKAELEEKLKELNELGTEAGLEEQMLASPSKRPVAQMHIRSGVQQPSNPTATKFATMDNYTDPFNKDALQPPLPRLQDN